MYHDFISKAGVKKNFVVLQILFGNTRFCVCLLGSLSWDIIKADHLCAITKNVGCFIFTVSSWLVAEAQDQLYVTHGKHNNCVLLFQKISALLFYQETIFLKSLYSFLLLIFQIGSDSAQSQPVESMKTSLHYDMVSWYISYVPPCKFRILLMHIIYPLTIFATYTEILLKWPYPYQYNIVSVGGPRIWW